MASCSTYIQDNPQSGPSPFTDETELVINPADSHSTWSCIEIHLQCPWVVHPLAFSDHRRLRKLAILELDAKMWGCPGEGAESPLEAEATAWPEAQDLVDGTFRPTWLTCRLASTPVLIKWTQGSSKMKEFYYQKAKIAFKIDANHLFFQVL